VTVDPGLALHMPGFPRYQELRFKYGKNRVRVFGPVCSANHSTASRVRNNAQGKRCNAIFDHGR
jgi:hypothetical protein